MWRGAIIVAGMAAAFGVFVDSYGWAFPQAFLIVGVTIAVAAIGLSTRHAALMGAICGFSAMIVLYYGSVLVYRFAGGQVFGEDGGNADQAVLGIVLAAVTIAVVTVALSMLDTWSWVLLVPVAIAAAVVVARRHPPIVALATGAAATFGVILLFAVPMIAYLAASGDLDTRGPDCDGFCTNTAGGVILMTFILMYFAIPTAIAGGVISMIASVVAGRAPRSA